MGLQPFNWSVVIPGHWNVAIFAPGQIAEKVFELPKGTKVQVMVPIDVMGPNIVEHPDGDIRILSLPNRLEFGLVKMDFDALEHAMSCAVKAIKWLPHTPVQAAGFNINYKTDESSSEMVKLYSKEEIDHIIGDLGIEITSRSIARTLRYDPGKINITFRGNNNNLEFLCNFHRDSNKIQDLIDWLSIPKKNVEKYIKEILEKFGLSLQEPSNDDPK
jgi:hypothetical protein